MTQDEDIPSEVSRLLDWPELSKEDRPRTLFVDSWVPSSVASKLFEKGWLCTDVRGMLNKTDGDKAECVKAYLEGVRVGTIKSDNSRLRHMELEAKIYGLVGTKEAAIAQEDSSIPEADLDSLLNFGSMEWLESISPPKPEPKKRGRPRKKAPAKESARV